MLRIMQRNLNQFMLAVASLALLLGGCQPKPIPQDSVIIPPDFAVVVETNAKQETHTSLVIANSSETIFPKDENLNASMQLWNPNGTLRAKLEVAECPEIKAGESIFPASAQWNLDAGVYFLTWGAPDYGSVMAVFSIVEKNDRLTMGTFQSFPLKPAQYSVVAVSAGSIQSFTMDENDTIILMGETPIPDMGHVFPLIFDANGLVEGMPTGQFASIADGRWRVEIPAGSVTLEPERMYSILLFTDDPAIGPSEPFVIHVSSPVQN